MWHCLLVALDSIAGEPLCPGRPPRVITVLSGTGWFGLVGWLAGTLIPLLPPSFLPILPVLYLIPPSAFPFRYLLLSILLHLLYFLSYPRFSPSLSLNFILILRLSRLQPLTCSFLFTLAAHLLPPYTSCPFTLHPRILSILLHSSFSSPRPPHIPSQPHIFLGYPSVLSSFTHTQYLLFQSLFRTTATFLSQAFYLDSSSLGISY